MSLVAQLHAEHTERKRRLWGETKPMVIRRRPDLEQSPAAPEPVAVASVPAPAPFIQPVAASKVSADVEASAAISKRAKLAERIAEQEETISRMRARIRQMDREEAQLRRVLSAKFCKIVVSDYFGIDVPEIEGQSRHVEIVRARWVAMYLIRNLTRLSSPQIGRQFGGRDHTSVLHGIRGVSDQMKADESFRKVVDMLRARIREGALT